MAKRFLIFSIALFLCSCAAENIHTAVKQGDIQRVAHFVSMGHVNQSDLYNDPNAAKLKESGADRDTIYKFYPYYGHTPIIIAAYYNQLDIAKYLLKNGADINAKAEDGTTALKMAAQNNNEDMVRLLLDNGADPNIMDWYGQTARYYTQNQDIIAMLSEAKASKKLAKSPKPAVYTDTPTALDRSSTQKTKDVRAWLKSGADINTTDQIGRTPLLWAAAQGQKALSLELIQKGADPQMKDKKGNTALMLASRHSDSDRVFLRSLLEKASSDQMKRIQSYQIDKTKLYDFLSDNWSIDDLYDGKIGVLSVNCASDCGNGNGKWVLGGVLFKAPDADSQIIFSSNYKSALAHYMKGDTLNIDNNFGAPVIPICSLIFENGVLKAKQIQP